MRLTSFVVWKSWGSNKVRTLLTILGVALGVAVVTTIHVLDHNTIHSRLQQRIANYGRVDLELLPLDSSRKPSAIRAELQAMQELISDVGLLHGGEAGSPAIAGTKPENATAVSLFGLSPLPCKSFAHYLVEQGEDLTDLDGDQFVLIGPGLATSLGIGVGDSFSIAPSNQTPPRCVDGKLVAAKNGETRGEISTVKVKGVLANHALGRSSQGQVVIGSFQLSRRVAPYGRSFYQVNRRKGALADDLIVALRKSFQVLDKRSAMLGERSDERAFRNGIKLIGLLALVLGMLVVFQTLSQTLMERLKQIGLMRCLGASRRAVARIFLLDGLLLALIGSAVGVGLGIGLAYLMGQMRWTTLGLGKDIESFEVPPQPVLFAAGLGIFFTLAGSAFPLWKARNLPPARVMQSRGLGDSGYMLRGVNVFLFVLLVIVLPIAYLAMTPLLAEGGSETQKVFLQVAGIVMLFGGILLAAPKLVKFGGTAFLWPLRKRFPLATFLVGKNLSRSPGRFSAAVVGLAIVLTAMVALKHVTYALHAEVQQFGSRTMDGHVFFDNGVVTPIKDLARIQAIPGVQSAEFVTGEQQVGFLLRGLRTDDLVREGAVLAGRPDLVSVFREKRTLIVSQRWAELHKEGAQPGKKIELLTGAGLKTYEVILVDDRAGFFPDERAWAVTESGWLERDFCHAAATCGKFALHLTSEADPYKVRESVQAVFPHKWFKRGDDHRDYLVRDVTKDFFLFDFLLFLILVLVGVGLVNTMTIAAVGRAREIGVLRALGMTDKSLRRTFLVEGAVVAFLGAAVAIVMGMPLGYVVVVGLNKVAGLDAPVVIPWLYVFLVPVLAMATGLIAAILPSSRAIKMSPAEAVRYE